MGPKDRGGHGYAHRYGRLPVGLGQIMSESDKNKLHLFVTPDVPNVTPAYGFQTS